MKNRLLKSWHIILCCAVPLISNSQDLQWEKSYGGIHSEYLSDAIPTADYGFILAGSSLSGKNGNKSSENKGNLDYWVWKMDEHGELVWQKSFGGPGIDLLRSVRVTDDGGFILSGSSNSAKGYDKKEDSRGDTDFWVIKLDAGGGEKWQRTLGGNYADDLVSIVQTPDGGYVLGGTSSSGANGDKSEESRGNTDYWIVKLDGAGNVKWQKTYGGQYADALRSISLTADGGYIVGGYSNSSESGDKTSKCSGSGDFWILKLNNTGDIEWQQTYGGEKDDQISTVFQTLDGNYIAGGYSNSDSGGTKTVSSRNGSDFWIIRIDKNGNSLWQRTYDFGAVDILNSLIQNRDGSFLLGGFAKSERPDGKDSGDINDYITLKISDTGDEKWQKTIGSDGDDVLKVAIETRDGGYLLAGTSNPTPKSVQNGNRAKIKKPTNGKSSAIASGAQSKIDHSKQQGIDAANEYYKEEVSQITSKVNDAVERGKESPLQIGLNDPQNVLGNGSNPNDKIDPALALSKKKQPASRSKSNNLGQFDFWVVKLKDNEKKQKARTNIEAIPNPAPDFTNIIVGYDYQNGVATVFDISGRQVQQQKLSGERTIPTDLSRFPEGIYVIEVKTDVSTDAVKVINSKQ